MEDPNYLGQTGNVPPEAADMILWGDPPETPVDMDDFRAEIVSRTPKELIRYRDGRGGRQFRYVTGTNFVARLNQLFGHAWSFEVKEMTKYPLTEPSRTVVVLGRLTVILPTGEQIVKEQFGSSEIKYTTAGDLLDFGNDLKSAATDAMKKCASWIGVFLDVYSDEELPSDRKITKGELTKLHALGSSIYGAAEWDTKRHELVLAITKGAITSSADLMYSEYEVLMKGLEKRLNIPQTLTK
jgi:hypothetical protein